MELASRLGAEILSLDSMQVYRGMDVGTAKPTPEDRARVPHHLIDLAEPEDEFTVAEFQAAGREVLDALAGDGVPALVAGGSGLHFRALVDPLDFPPTDPGVRAGLEALPAPEARRRLERADPDAAAHVDLANPRRVLRALEVLELTGLTPSRRAGRPEAAALREYRPAVPLEVLGIDPGDALADRAAARIEHMHELGLLDEVRELAPRLGRTARQAVNYKELLPVVAGEASLDDGKDAQLRATLALAKRQRTYFGRDPRITWLPWHDDPARRADAAWAALQEAPTWTS